MSHLTTVKSNLINLDYLKSALDALNISYKEQNSENISIDTIESINKTLVIEQPSLSDIEVYFDKVGYAFRYDTDFWSQSLCPENFINQINQKYACELIIGESQKIGFQAVNYQKNQDGSNTVVLERWKTKN